MATLAQSVEITHFSGSYAAEDVELLLQPTNVAPTDVATKEKLIQTGKRHYSEMISEERAPDPAYVGVYEKALDAGSKRMANDLARLAQALSREIAGDITLVSLVRAGLPVGVVLKRALKALGRDVAHYGVSIIRDRGIDEQAMRHITARRDPAGVVFVDGWTGKGAIIGELEKSLAGSDVLPRLVVVADPCGRAWLSASGDDWLIPSGILGATVSGLVSRSILNDEIIASGGFHGCLDLVSLSRHDVSRAFVDQIWAQMGLRLLHAEAAVWTDADRARHSAVAQATVGRIVADYSVSNLNRVKPGIAEATRAVLRRMPERVFISDPFDPDLAALVYLATDRGVRLETLHGGIAPYRAVTLIGKAS
ncbi:cysteine protease StiP family protein [Chenggangzhangella methanolivorans]|uniref:Cysteine protease StiP family protein n=1 Tax=Chenggangzhangella methanolivorans TaxID=1437009 RepID=A0A9E6RFY4_9HYPH|nr:cysteine protease StiP family protein [Chenggangzhangella methanolivorans]QZO00651.1 cysteine protease StiP family protein [Chenggangzhangella methanolivorans]